MEIYETLGILGAVIGFLEWRLRVYHKCIERIEKKMDEHIKETKPILERFYRLEERFSK